MKNNEKNALNVLGLLVFMALAWATSPPRKFPEPVTMTVAINADSTAFILTNLENRGFTNGYVEVFRRYDTTHSYYTSVYGFSMNEAVIAANQSIMLPFNQFIGFDNSKKEKVSLSKNVDIEVFTFLSYLRTQNGKRIYATFDFKFESKINGKAP
jgi:hypothetical protein